MEVEHDSPSGKTGLHEFEEGLDYTAIHRIDSEHDTARSAKSGGIGVILIILANQTTENRGEVRAVEWQLSVEIMEQRPVEREDWEDDLPRDAVNVSCKDKYYETRSEPAPKSTEVCGTPYTIDQGSGAGQVVQDCEYRVYASSCTYTVLDWTVVETLETSGFDNNPYWPVVNLSSDQREGNRTENYAVTFAADGKNYSYHPDNADSFSQFVPGSEWTLTINGLNAITDIKP